MALASLLLVGSLVVIATLWKLISNARHSSRTLPRGLRRLPGPKGLPFLGSVLDLPEKNTCVKLHEWAKEYGPIYQTNIAGTNHVWITSDRIARDLLSKKGAIYSDRPQIPGLIDNNRTSAQYLPLLGKTPAWTRQRKFGNHIMRESEKAQYYRYPELESKRMLVELMERPSDYNHIIESFISRVTCRLAWGHSEPSEELKQRARELLYAVSPAGALGNRLPFVMDLPDWLSPAKAWERRRKQTERRFLMMMQEQVEEDVKERRAPASWMKTYLETPDAWGFTSDVEGAYCVGMHAIAGALTIAAVMQTFCLGMTYYPQYMPILQEELDRVCGDRLPVAEDRPNLPFLRAVIRECLRWRPAVATGIPHKLDKDDTWNDYYLPAGSMMHALEWGIARDPDVFPDPEAFNPLRWVRPEYPTYREPLTEHPSIINISQFGYGRRTCLGQAVADEDMLIGVGSIAWLFNIAKKAEEGAEDEESDEESEAKDSGYESFSEAASPIWGEYSLINAVIADSEGKLDNLLGEKMAEIQSKLAEKSFGQDDDENEQQHRTPGAWPIQSPVEVAAEAAAAALERRKRRREQKAKKLAAQEPKDDPTLNYSHLLIAKPVPFSFDLTVRNQKRAAFVRKAYEEHVENGDFLSDKSYWGANQGRDKPLGWGVVKKH